MSRKSIYALAGLGVAIVLALLLWVSGGSQGSRSGADNAVGIAQKSAQESEQTFRYAMNLVLKHDEFDAATTFEEAIRRLNQWARHQSPPDDWALDPLVSALPEPLTQIAPMQGLPELKFRDFDRLHLQETVWLRDAAEQARGTSLDPVARAASLFDWVVRNIQLESPVRPGLDLTATVETRLPRLPWETLLYGRGEAVDRAWLFALMARQQRLDVVLLGIPDSDTSSGLRTWAPALVHQGELYVFEPSLGIPVPGPDGAPVATLSQLRADDALLRQLDVDAEHRYPLESARLESVVALVEASPGYLSQRMRLVQSKLAGNQAFVLSSSPQRTAETLRGREGIADVLIWAFPLQTYRRLESPGALAPEALASLQRDMLPFNAGALPAEPATLRMASLAMQRGRILQLKGRHDGAEGAGALYQAARLPDSEIDVGALSPEQKALLVAVKENASYWMGLICQDHGRYEAAIDYFQNRLLKPFPSSIWAPGARYNLARSLEALDRSEEALAEYEVPTESAYWWGNQLAIRRLKADASQEARPSATAP